MRTDKKKPWNQGQVRHELTNRGIKVGQAWIVGDRLMTDIYLANRVGCQGILVSPVEKSTIQKHGWIVCGLRWIENGFLRIHGWK